MTACCDECVDVVVDEWCISVDVDLDELILLDVFVVDLVA